MINCCSRACTLDGNYFGLSNWQIYRTLLGLLCASCMGAYSCVPGPIQSFFQHSAEITGFFIFLRFLCHIPGLFQCLFYYLSVWLVYKKMKKAYDDYDHAPHCWKKQYVFYIYSTLIPLGIITGFVEKWYRCYIPNAMTIDVLAVAWAFSCKPDFMLTISNMIIDLGYENFDYTDNTAKLFRWIEGGLTLFCGARNIGMMAYCTGLFTPKKSTFHLAMRTVGIGV